MKKLKHLQRLSADVHTALETYANVHRGSGHNSLVTTHLYEQAGEIVLEHLRLSGGLVHPGKYAVIFCTPRRAALLQAQLAPGSYHSVSSQEIGLPLGVWALAVARKALPKGAPFQTGGGTARLVAPGWVIWAKAPDRFEAGTPAIVNVIAFAVALRLIRRFGKDAFRDVSASKPAGAEKQAAAEILYRDELEKYSGRELLDELRQTLIGRNVRVPTAQGAKPFVNLDNAASTPTFEPIWNAVCQAWRQPGLVQGEIIQEARTICAETLGARPADYDVVFTSNTTEAINLVADSLRNELDQDTETIVLNTFLEHNSNELPWRTSPGLSLIRLPVDAEGFIDLNEMETLLRAYNEEGLNGPHQAGDRERRLECPRHVQRPGGDQPHRSPLWRALAGGRGPVGRSPQGRDGRMGHRLSRLLCPQGVCTVRHRRLVGQERGCLISARPSWS